MRLALLLVVAGACEQDAPKIHSPPRTLTYECQGGGFGTPATTSSTTWDLGAKTAGGARLTDKQVAALDGAIDKVLKGGPYKEELPPPEGTSCILTIREGSAVVFSIAKASTREHDAVSALVNQLRP